MLNSPLTTTLVVEIELSLCKDRLLTSMLSLESAKLFYVSISVTVLATITKKMTMRTNCKTNLKVLGILELFNELL